MKNKKYYNIETIPKSNIKIIETEAKLIPQTHIYIRSRLYKKTCVH
jgi:hypothetical protein